ncbi:glycosyl hydrolase [Hephaestia sp. GCM10023244]|uniref:glycosyl hydrolase n=1 Tax=unclassified Hephaestia TaxID=2631281 RepID=UPI0020777386|nr:glycosyl hydrolase [Hephaestia sp. MAHUQ-44]MCM8730532.1 alpha-L-arabinofuranosidase [Hephaestia sp. MAHUQ-44]
MRAIGRWTTGSALAVLAMTAATAQDRAAAPAPAPSAAPDAETFRNPPMSARPGTFYHWMNGNVTKEGLDSDLTGMRDIGLGGAMMFDGSSDVPKGPVDYMSPHWLDLMTHMASKAGELGLEVGVHNAPGWSSSGGPWVTPALSMQQIVWTETTVAGGKPLSVKLARPYAKRDYYRDAFVIAFPASQGDESYYRERVASMRVGAGVSAATLTDRNLNTVTEIAPGTPLIVTMKAPFTARAVTLYGAHDAVFSATIEASDDGVQWRPVGKVSVGRERGIESPGSLNFPAVTARHFRITPTTKAMLAEALFYASPRIDDWGMKGEHAFEMAADPARHATDSDTRDAIDPNKVIDITDKLAADGTLRWTPPAGRWTVMRFGHTSTGHINVAASDAGRGLEIDKLSAAAVDYQFDNSVGKMAKAAGSLVGKSFNMAMIDSFEAGLQNWTPTLPHDFAARNDYDIRPYLPALTGRIVGDRDTSDRFLFDFRRTLADMMVDNYYGRMQQRANEAGLRFFVEGYGPGAFDALQVSGRAQIPTSEFWSRTPWTDNRTVKMVASAAHVYGKNVIAAEAFTGEAETSRWQDFPYSMKTLGDQMFALGVNQILFHRAAHQPNPKAAPGMVMGPWGINLDRSNTWFGQGRPWIDYLTRAQYMLRQGTYVADLLYFVGEDSPNQSEYVRPDVGPDTNPKIGVHFDPKVPAGYQYDLVNAEVLLTRARIEDGRIVLANGASYRMLVIPDGIDGMTPTLAAKLREFVDQGMAIMGSRPAHPMTLAGKTDGDTAFHAAVQAVWGDGEPDRHVGKGRVFASGPVGEALAKIGVVPDAQCTTAHPGGQVVWMHRALDASDMYFVANRERRAETISCTFRVGDAAPALWDAETGTISHPALFESNATTTRVVFDLAPAGSTFVMLDRAPKAAGMAWAAKDGKRFADVTAPAPTPAAAPRDSFTISGWAKPDIDLRLMPDESIDGRINETGKNYLVSARSGHDIHGEGTAIAGLAIGRNGAFVIERVSADKVPAVLVSHQPLSGWTHVALVYDGGTPHLYLNGTLVRSGLKSGRPVFAGGGDPAAPNGVTYFFEGNATPLRTDARVLSAAEIAAEAAAGPPAAAIAQSPADLTRTEDGGLKALVWESGRYTTSSGARFTAKVPAPRVVEGPWTVAFEPGRGAPAQTVLPELESLSRNADAGIRHFAGTATYTRSIDVPAALLRKGRRVYLDLGRVEVISDVTINGQKLGITWKEPYRVDITDVVRAGANSVSLEVANLWTNRLIADAALPEEGNFVDAEWPVGERFSADGKTKTPIMARKITELPDWYKKGQAKPAGGRVAFAPWNFYSKDEALVDSGLLGPVRVVFADEVTVKPRK